MTVAMVWTSRRNRRTGLASLVSEMSRSDLVKTSVPRGDVVAVSVTSAGAVGVFGASVEWLLSLSIR